MIGKTISHYKITEELGGGGVGIVYKAQDLKLDRFVALKFLRSNLSSDEEERKRFINEAKAISVLNHNNICTIYDIDVTQEGQMFICMAYYEGETLEKKISYKYFKIDEALDVVIQVIRGLIKAHNSGIIHRDIKPSNIIITDTEEVKIIDFGLAKLIGHTSLSKNKKTLGTIAYMSPEQANSMKVDHRTDIWSLGIVLYKIITGKLPFYGEYEQAIIYSILNEEPKPITELRTGVATKLEWIIEKAIAKNLDDRYQHMDEILVDLLAYRSDPDSIMISESLTKRKPTSSIAVLPFADMSLEKDQEYFCDGMAEEIINALSQVDGLRVTSRTSSFQFKEQAKDIRLIGEQLNVRMVLEGSVRKTGNKMRITAKLIKVTDGFQLWSKRFESKTKDIFAIQDEISEAIVNILKTTLIKEEKSLLIKRYTDNIEAYNLYLQGRYFWAKRTETGLNKGIKYFRQAIKIEDKYALAYAGLADSYIMLGTYGNLPPKEAMISGREAAQHALEIDDSLAEAYTSLGCVRAIYDRDWKKSEEDFRYAIELKPSYSTAHHWYAINCLVPQKRFDEAFSHIKRALDLDPLSLYKNSTIGLIYYFSQQYDLAIDKYHNTIDMDSHFGIVNLFLGQALTQKGLYEEAILSFQKAIELHGETTNLLANIAYFYAVLGKEEEALSRLKQLHDISKEKYVSAYDIAVIYSALGNNENAFKWLENAYIEKSYLLIYFDVDPNLSHLWSDNKCSEFLVKLGLI